MALQIILFLTLMFAMIMLSEEYSVTMSSSPPLTSKATEEQQITTQHRNPCLDEYQEFCLNGHCVFNTHLTSPLCRCHSGFTGERCEHMLLPSHTTEDKAVYIAIGIGLGLLISGVFIFIWHYRKKRCRRTEYENCPKTEATKPV
ncbi:hypothetical protein GDO86_000751 [Hymenochirus boettgeri]|uniref:EGF-like domain-containing protein n=1 Tax=Hymenochirus boettgeri TaxID=247094 RepID=A0A8T2KFQ4_9PIPI|nr:hypothetical protein GDO86_000751 [Hymenochirus boettgeri]